MFRCDEGETERQIAIQRTRERGGIERDRERERKEGERDTKRERGRERDTEREIQ